VLLARAIANRDLACIVGLRPTTIDIVKTITIDAPVERVFALWTKVQRFPLFMEHVREVRLEAPERSRWVVDGPFGRASIEAELVKLEHDKLIAWRTLPGSELEHEGSVQLDEVDHGTRIHIHLRYHPPGGIAGHAIAKLFGFDPRSRMDDDLVRVKALLEHGKTRAHHRRVKLGDVPWYS
jgi:uncharacterized membrane protein